MYPRSTILGHFVLLILLLVTSSSDSRKDFLPDYEYYDLDGDGKLDLVVKYPRLEYICLLVSLPFLLLTFVVYSILPDLQNMHGYTLRAHVASLFVANVMTLSPDGFPILIKGNYCFLIIYTFIFSYLSSLFWLNVICFDIWRTLSQFRSCRTNLKKQEIKRFIMYSIYAWGISFILIVVYAILDIPSISKHLSTPPGVCVVPDKSTWFTYRGMVYFYVPVGVSIIVNICLFIAMVLTVWYHDKQTANQLRNSRSSRHNIKYTIYVKLSLVLGIDWIMQITFWLTDNFVLYDEKVDTYVRMMFYHLIEVIDIFQGVVLFFAFVWKKKIMLLLLKRFGCQGLRLNISRNNDCPPASPSPTTHHTAEMHTIRNFLMKFK